MVEYEKKLMLTKAEYTAVKKHIFRGVKPFVQINRYFDTDDLKMYNSNITCRIREKNGLFEATVKEHDAKIKEKSLEHTRVIKATDRSVFGTEGIKYQGSLITFRLSRTDASGIKIMLDRNIYLDREDYELEIEYNPDSKEEAKKELENTADLLYSCKIIANTEEFQARAGKGENKSSRFFKRLTEIKLS